MPRDLAARFWSHVWRCDHEDCSRCCWLWKPSVVSAFWSSYASSILGYEPPEKSISKLAKAHGQFIVRKGESYSAHRFAYMLAHGALLLPFSGFDMHICHQCDFGPCCNPSHLYVGTAHDNRQDVKARWYQRGLLTILLPNGQRISRIQPLTEAMLTGLGPLAVSQAFFDSLEIFRQVRHRFPPSP